MASSNITVPVYEGPRIRVSMDDVDDWFNIAIAFYKRSFCSNTSVSTSISGQPGIDTGGIRRQFFSTVFHSNADSFFNGLPDRLRPAFKASIHSSGILLIIGTMIAHSIVLDGQGFPYLADYVYDYLAGYMDKAISCVTMKDAGERVQFISEQVCFCLLKDICVCGKAKTEWGEGQGQRNE